jgi:hypothetical protein
VLTFSLTNDYTLKYLYEIASLVNNYILEMLSLFVRTSISSGLTFVKS